MAFSLQKISLYFHTIRYLRPIQIYYRLKYMMFSGISPKAVPLKVEKFKHNFVDGITRKQTIFPPEKFHFLNTIGYLSMVDWNGNQRNRLWRYNQHYFDDLNAKNSEDRENFHYNLILDWVRNNPVKRGVGWEPYPTSLRVVNWIKWFLRGNSLPAKGVTSLATQSRWLSARLEYHLLGNHLFANAKALIFAGLIFNGPEAKNWLAKGISIIDKELAEQVLEDGGNFELSPMYHSIFLEDLLDLINIFKCYPQKVPEGLVKSLRHNVSKMLYWLEIMSHPDGEISFFNDSSLSVAPSLEQLTFYASRLDIFKNKKEDFHKISHLKDSGYIRVKYGSVYALLDVAKLGPNYLPGHAHADTLSFELSFSKHRVFVNSGTSDYENSKIRLNERGTAAHNTVVIDNQNSSETWSSFRVARRALPSNLSLNEIDDQVNISCSHNGYKRLSGKVIHHRKWQFQKNLFTIEDNILGRASSAIGFYHFHPNVNIFAVRPECYKLVLSNSLSLVFEIEKGKSRLIDSFYSPQFGLRIRNQAIQVALDKNKLSVVSLKWEITN